MKPLSLQGHTRALTRVRINRDGDLLFTSSKDHTPCVWYLENGERIGTYIGHSGVIWDIDVSWDTKTLVSSSGDPSVKVWDVETGKVLGTRRVKTVGRSVSLSYSGHLVAYTTTKVAMTEPMLFVADIRDPSQLSSPSQPTEQTDPSQLNSVGNVTLDVSSNRCVFSHLDDTIVVGATNGHLHQYDLRNFDDAVNFCQTHSQNINDLQVSHDEGFIISSSADKTAQLHDAKSLDTLKTYRHTRPVNSAAISPTHDYICLGGGEEAINVTHTAVSSGQFEAKLYHMVYENEFAFFKGHFGPINTLAYSPDGRTIVTGSEDGFVRIQEMDQEYFDFQFQSDY
ncbi:Eukaryotic translation initiation factor 3 subunit I [Aphelenchoides besseyi]|nr:Eukaryotic translation initiation factor 3 subunit I [Aphelenchoides besseyi]KAI6207907.1 Eukaryotic translation initiation factor 3 subunit I [Aphelenchoides besseyi]